MTLKLATLSLILIAGFTLSAIADEESRTATRRDATDVATGDIDQWRYSLQQPTADWHHPDFDASDWKTGAGGFGTRSTPNATVGTVWDTKDIWLRRSFYLRAITATPALWIHHDEDAEVFINGKQVATLSGFSKDYAVVAIKQSDVLKVGSNVIAVHCHQTRGGQFINVDVIDAKNPPKLAKKVSADKKSPTRQSVEMLAPIQTPWDSKVDPDHVLPEYPRPQLVREQWQNLNGHWDWALTGRNESQPSEWSGKILVPFCFESEASGVNREVLADQWMWYHRTFETPKGWNGKRVWMNFEASDWETVVYINGQEVGTHQGGYTPFSLDVTDHLKPSGPQEVVVRVWDHHGQESFASIGKQHEGKNYERCSGIWQTVWLEPRGVGAITRAKINGSWKQGQVEVSAQTDGRASETTRLKVEVLDGYKVVAEQSGAFAKPLSIAIPNPKPWQPDDPFLYGLRISLVDGQQVVDQVTSYCGLRDIWIDKTLDGPQIVLNGKAFFHFGPLDQGYWPVSGLTPPTEEALAFELQYCKDSGCNMVRLHIKRNASRWYYHSDRLGLMVWQDFIVNKDGKSYAKQEGESERWKNEQSMLMESLNNHPSVVKWIVFNEAWGQHDTVNVVKWAESVLPNHIVSAASGWNDVDNLANVRDLHDYERFPSFPHPTAEPNRVVVQGETGGFGVPINGNNWLPMPDPRLPESPDGRVGGKDRQGGMNPVNASADRDFISDIKRPVYTAAGMVPHYERYIQGMWLGQSFDLSGAVYTQLTDMRHEQNGWLTFDRKVSKIPIDKMKQIYTQLYRPIPQRKPLLKSHSTWIGQDGRPNNAPFAFTDMKPATYLAAFDVAAPVDQASLNIEITTKEPNVSGIGFLLVYLDGQLIFDDKTRHKKPEHRISCVPLTAEQVALLTPGTHELKIEVNLKFPIAELDVHLDALR